MWMRTLDIHVKQGDTFAMEITCIAGGEPLDISNQEFEFKGMHEPIVGKSYAFEGKCMVTDGKKGKLLCVIPSEETGKLKNKRLYAEEQLAYYDIWCKSTQQRLLQGTVFINTGISYRKERNL